VNDESLVQHARRLADEVLFPAALDVDAAELVPRSHLDRLAAEGLYGLSGPTESGGVGADRATAARVTEVLAGGCLATTFVWLQHQGVVRRLADASDAVRDRWLAALCRGELRAGVAVAGVRPGPEPLRATRDGGDWVLDGTCPWVTGWGLIDVVHVAARTDDGDVVWLLLDAVAGPTWTVDRQHLVAVDASSTVTVAWSAHPVPGDRLTSRSTYHEWQDDDARGLRGNGSLALGVAARCAALLDNAALRRDVDVARDALDSATAAGMPAARADASALAWRAAGLLVLGHGSRSVLRDQHAQRLAREAMFLLVFGSRPEIRDALFQRLG
jgi:alkylation response protein AidB-like acyl-CoA dehydrogenase